MDAGTPGPRSLLSRMLAALVGVALTCACAPADRPADPGPETPAHREVLVDRGSADVVDLRPVTVEASPGDVVVLRSANPGSGADDESPVHHLFTSAPAEALPPLFTPTGGGLAPNGGVWGVCRGGSASAATAGCPVPPIEGPRAYDGRAYFSLGALLPGDRRELPLADDLPLGTYRFTCAIHPQHHVDVEVVTEPRAARDLPPLDAARVRRSVAKGGSGTPAGAVVHLGPHTQDPPTEVLLSVPAVVRVPVGGTVVWQVDVRSPHTVELGHDEPPSLAHTAPADTVPLVPAAGRWNGIGEVRSGILSADPSVGRVEFDLTFTRPGRYRAFDRFHGGVVTVVEVG